jgi:hypothetical protein
MSSSVKQVFENTTKNFVSDFSHQLSDWLKNHKEVEVSAEELCSVFDAPYRPPSTPGMNGSSVQTVLPNVNSMPLYFSNESPSSSSAGAKKKGGRAKKVVDPNLPKCAYKMAKGKNAGAPCPNTVSGAAGILGSDRYCTPCLKKASVQKDLAESGPSTTVQPPSIPGSSVNVEASSSEKTPELSVVEIPGRAGWYKEQTHNFCVNQEEGGQIVAHSVLTDNGERPLTEPERKMALNMGLQVVTPKVSLPTIPKSGISIPTVPTIPNVTLPLH